MKNYLIIALSFFILSCSPSKEGDFDKLRARKGTLEAKYPSEEEWERRLVLSEPQLVGEFTIKPGIDSVVGEVIYAREKIMIFYCTSSNLSKIIEEERHRDGTSNSLETMEEKVLDVKILSEHLVSDGKKQDFDSWEKKHSQFIPLMHDRSRARRLKNDSTYLSLNGHSYMTLPFDGGLGWWTPSEPKTKYLEKGGSPREIALGPIEPAIERTEEDGTKTTESIHFLLGYLSYDPDKKYDFDAFFTSRRFANYAHYGDASLIRHPSSFNLSDFEIE